MTEGYTRPTRGVIGAPILIVCDSPTAEAHTMGLPMAAKQLKWLGEVVVDEGLDPKQDFYIIGLCPPIAAQDKNSATRKWASVLPHVEDLHNVIARANPRLVVTFGELATRAVLGRAVKITKARGMPVPRDGQATVLPMLSPGFVARLPDHRPTFVADVHTVAMLKSSDFDLSRIERTETNYEWRTDISDFLGENKPSVIAVDTETTGLRWWEESVVPITVQFSTGPGVGIVCCVDEVYWRRWLEPIVGPYNRRTRSRLVGQLSELLEDPEVRKIGQNLKYDHHICRKLNIETNGWLHDTMVMGFAVDENALSLGLDELVRVHVPEMSGYADDFNRTYDKANMRAVPPEDLLKYAGGDPDATFRLARVLQSRLRIDPKQQRVYRRVQMPAVMCFANVIEPYGLRVDKGRLRELGQQVDEWLAAEYKKLIRTVPARVRRKHLNAGKDLVFSRPDFVRDALFSPDGFALTPSVFTKSTRDLEDETKRVPSTSAKDHLPYFTSGDHLTQEVKDFVADLIEFQKTQKLRNTYYGDEGDVTGFWKYLSPSGRLHPSFGVTFTNTGRTNSRDPNAQNFPKRGSQWAKPFGSIFIPTDGYQFVTADLSQIELRIAAWMAMEPTMLRIYREGGDIHVVTAAAVVGITPDQFAAYLGDERPLIEVANEIPGSGDYLRKINPGKRAEVTVKEFFGYKRFQAKSINFGFLYSMQWRGYMRYAKTEFGIDVTEEEAQAFRETFFRLYPGLVAWHDTMREFAGEHGHVRALHGACRHLPSINSSDFAMQRAAERFAVNSPVQRFGSDLGLIATSRLTHQSDPEIMRALNFVHDQLITEVKDGHIEECGAALKWVMQTPPLFEWFDIEPPLPIFSDLEVGNSLGSMEERGDIQAAKPDWWQDDEDAAMASFLSQHRGAGAAL